MSCEKLSLNLKSLLLIRITSSGLSDFSEVLIENKNWLLPDQDRPTFFNLEPGLQNHPKDD